MKRFNNIIRYKISILSLCLLVIGYLFLPIFLFLFKWTNICISIISAMCLFGAISYWYIKVYDKDREKRITLSLIEEVVVFLLFSLFFVFVGHSDMFPQDGDWSKHHAIFYDLLHYNWPVVYQNNTMLTYYLGQYIVPAEIGKIFHQSEAVMKLAIIIWNSLGITLAYTYVCYYLKSNLFVQKLGIALFFIFFGGCTNIGQEIFKLFGYENIMTGFEGNFKWIDLWRINVHYASNYDTLYGAFQHIIAPWLCCCLLLENMDRKYTYAMIAIPLLFTSTFGFVYFVILLLMILIIDFYKAENKLGYIKEVVSLGNILVIPTAIVILIYLMGNVMAVKPDGMGFELYTFKGDWLFYVVFVFVEFACYGFCLYKKNKRNPLFYMIILQLLFIPFIKLGLYNDLCSRGAVPARFILMIFCIQQLYESKWSEKRNIVLLTFLCISALNTEVQIWKQWDIAVNNGFDSSLYISDEYKSFEGYAGNLEIAKKIDNAYNYFTFDYSNALFYKISKH